MLPAVIWVIWCWYSSCDRLHVVLKAAVLHRLTSPQPRLSIWDRGSWWTLVSTLQHFDFWRLVDTCRCPTPSFSEINRQTVHLGCINLEWRRANYMSRLGQTLFQSLRTLQPLKDLPWQVTATCDCGHPIVSNISYSLSLRLREN
jgi:predicted methyltransferase